MKNIFITGTDTGIGKTVVTMQLLKQFNAKGYKTAGFKPVASGCQLSPAGEWVNEDALLLQKTASIYLPYSLVNPIALQEPIAPHLAAKHMGIDLSVAMVKEKLLASIEKSSADINIIEGIGGWAVPLNDDERMSKVICELEIPVILVVGIKLGCLNHAILTSEMIIRDRGHLIAWVANCLEPNSLCIEENIMTLKRWISGPCWGVMPYVDRRPAAYPRDPLFFQ